MARVLSGMGPITAEASRVILAAAVIDDVIGWLVLAVVSSMAAGQVSYLHIALTAGLAKGVWKKKRAALLRPSVDA